MAVTFDPLERERAEAPAAEVEDLEFELEGEDEIPDPDDEEYAPRIYRTDRELAVHAPTWVFSEHFTQEDFKKLYPQNPMQVLRDYASRLMQPVEALFRNPEILRQYANPSRQNPVLADGTFAPWFLPTKSVPHFMHYDMSLNRDATGIAMAHWDRDAVRKFPDGQEVTGQIVVDFMHRVKADPGRDIDYDRLRQMAYSLKSRGFYIQLATFDRFQSADIMQALEKRGFLVDLFSVDRNTGAYDTMVEMVLQRRLDYGNYSTLIEELEGLVVKNGRKIDHRQNKAKDVADAVAAACFHARCAAGMEVYATSRGLSAKDVPKASVADEKRRMHLLGFRDTRTVW